MRRINIDMSEYFGRTWELDWFVIRLAKNKACAEGPVGLKYYDMLHRAVCGGELADFDAGPGPYYSIILIAHYLWSRGDVCAACVLLEKLSNAPLRDYDEITATKLLKAAVRKGVEGVKSVKTDDSPWSWSSLFKILLIAELSPEERAEALKQIRRTLEVVEETIIDLTDEIIEGYNIILQPKTPYIYALYRMLELERHLQADGGSVKNLLFRILFRTDPLTVRVCSGWHHISPN
jgi:cyanate lyase